MAWQNRDDQIVMAPPPAASRIGAFVTTIAAHLLVIAALIAGLRQAQIIRPQETVISFVPYERKAPELPPPSAPALVDPVIAIIPAPVIPAAPPAPSPAPMMLPSPPSADPQASNAIPTWETALLQKVQQARSSVRAIRSGVVLVRFSMDRDGHVLVARIEKSAGDEKLDQQALAALLRAQPLPAPPAEVPGNSLDLIVPVDFF